MPEPSDNTTDTKEQQKTESTQTPPQTDNNKTETSKQPESNESKEDTAKTEDKESGSNKQAVTDNTQAGMSDDEKKEAGGELTSTNSGKKFGSDIDKEKNAKLAKEHPEMTVDGIYYATEEARDKALKEKEERIAKESAQATAEAKAEAAQLAQSLKTIQKTLYGNNAEVYGQLGGDIGGIQLNAALGDAASVRSRQRLLDFNKFLMDYKEPSSGKPPHNKDPFPVDNKIEEFEAHNPTIKIHEVTTHVHGEAATIAAMHTSDAAEKRIVHLENNMATVMRYLFRLGSRVMINCVYYGGQTTFEKYKCIRCMRSDRIGDGQMMQIDQCMACTRYEPVFGQVYEIMNDLGINVAQVLDDNQMSYMNNEDYIKMSRIEEFQEAHERAKIKLSEVCRAQNQDDKGFDLYWGNGIKVNWTLVPVEDQKCHINWRQSINDDGSRLGRLASWMDQADLGGLGGGAGMATNSKKKTNLYIENQKAMDSNQGNTIYGKWVQAAIDFTHNKIDVAATAYSNHYGEVNDAIGSNKDIDPLAVLSASIAAEGMSYTKIVEDYRNTMTAIGGSQNPAFVWTAMHTNVEIVKLYIEGKIDDYIASKKLKDKTSDSESGSSSDSSSKDKKSEDNTTVAAPTSKETIPAPNIVETGLQMVKSTGSLGKVEYITLHHLGGGHDMSAQQVHNLHINNNGWAGIGYHYLIRWDGTIERGRPEDLLGAHVENHNTGNIGINVSGTWMEGEEYPEPSDEQMKSLVSLVADICKRHDIQITRDTLKGHRDWSGHESNSCPGDNLYNKIDSVVKSVQTGTYVGMKESELWVDFVEKLKEAMELEGTVNTEGLSMFPKICFMYVNLLSKIKNSSFDGAEWGFPFNDEQIRGFSGQCVHFTSPYGPRNGKFHEGVDLQPGGTADSGYDMDIEFGACKDGIVVEAGDGGWSDWNGVTVDHQDGTWSRYLHCKALLVKSGDVVKKGQALGYVGGYGPELAGGDGPVPERAYAYHLHLEMGKGSGANNMIKSDPEGIGIDPETQWKSPVDNMWTLE